MKLTPRNCLWLGLAAMIGLSLLWKWMPAQVSVGRLCDLPTAGFGFAGRDLPLTETEARIYRRAEVVKRFYQAGGQPFILTAVDGAHDRHAVHDPIYCLRGDGWQVVREQIVPVPGGRATLLSLARSGRHTEVVFWFTDRRERHSSAWRAWWLSLLHRVSFGQSGCEPALVLLQPGAAEMPHWASLFARCPFLFEL